MGFVDLHAHVLPALDDGSPDLATSLGMLKSLAAVGYERITATPHQKAAQFLPTREQIDVAHAETKNALAEAGVKLELGLAAENYWDDVFYSRWSDGSFPRYDGGKAFLFEIRPEDAPPRFQL